MKPTLVALEAMTGGINQLAAAAMRHGCTLTICTNNPQWYTAVGDRAKFCVVDTEDWGLTRSAVQQLADVVGVFSPTDTWAVRAARLAASLDLPVVNDASTVEWFRDKRNVSAAAGDGFVSGLECGPYIVKPAVSTGSIGVRVVADYGQAVRLAEAVAGTVERYELGPLYSAEVYVAAGEIVFLGVTSRIVADEPAFVETLKGFPYLAGSAWELSVVAWVQQLVAGLKPWRGFLHVEFIETRAGFRLVEVNPRLGGALVGPAVAACTNVDPYEVMVADALGREVVLPERVVRDCGFAHVSVYTQAAGVLTEIVGPERLDRFPGDVSWVPGKRTGDVLTGVLDYRARLGHVVARRECVQLAQDTALSAARIVSAKVASGS